MGRVNAVLDILSAVLGKAHERRAAAAENCTELQVRAR